MGEVVSRPWVLLRGLVREQRHWGRFPKELEAALGDACSEVYPMDMTGMGTEAGKDVPRDMRSIVDDLRARLQNRGLLRQRPVIFSMSLGSMCATEWAHLYPDELSGVVLINTSASNLAKFTDRLSLRAMGDFLNLIGTQDKFERELRILRLTTRFHKTDEEVAKEWASYAPDLNELLKVGFPQLWIASRYKAPESLKTSALILSSAKDELANPLCSAALAQRFGVPNHVHLGAGHDVILDDPEWVIKKLMSWVPSLPTPSYLPQGD